MRESEWIWKRKIWRLVECRECEILAGCLMPEHIHVLVAIPPKYAVSQVMEYIKGKKVRYA